MKKLSAVDGALCDKLNRRMGQIAIVVSDQTLNLTG